MCFCCSTGNVLGKVQAEARSAGGGTMAVVQVRGVEGLNHVKMADKRGWKRHQRSEEERVNRMACWILCG